MGLRKKVAIVFIGMLALAALNLGLLHRMLQEFNGVAATATVAGKMRMLGQKLAYETLSVSSGLTDDHEAVEHDLIDFEAAYLVLRSGGTAFNEVIHPLGASHDAALGGVWLAWRQYRNQIRLMLTSAGQVGPADVAGQQKALAESSATLLEHTDRLIQDLVGATQATQQDMLGRMYTLLVVNALMLMAAYLAISAQIVAPLQRLARYCRELAKGHYGKRIQHAQEDEIGQLARALNESSAQIGELMNAIEYERKELYRTSAMFRGLARNAVTGVFVIDGNMRFRYVNSKLAQMFGYQAEEMASNLTVPDLLVEADLNGGWKQTPADDGQRSSGSATSHYETRARHRDGSFLDLEVFASRMVLDGAPAIIGIALNVTERKKAEASIRRAALVYANTSEAVVVTDFSGTVIDVNPAFTVITGYTAQETIGQPISLLSSGRQDAAFYQAMWRSLLETGKWTGDIWNRRKDGTEYAERLTIDTSYNEDGTVNCRIGVFSDVTAERLKEETVWQQANFDHLTALPNRQMFHDELQRAMEHADRAGHSLALIYLDLDLFKEVNDSLGHDMGDELLKQVAKRLNLAIRQNDLVARLGGDEFVLILSHVNDLSGIEDVCHRVLKTVAEPYMLRHNVVTVSASLGVTQYPRDGSNVVELLQNADLAMYSAKDAGRNQYRHFSPLMQQEAQERRELLRHLLHAQERDEFELYFQPIVELSTRKISKAEALIRWHHSERGLIPPGDFIPLAEDSGLIVPIGDWVFRQAAAQAAKWRQSVGRNFQVSVNVSPEQLMSEDLNPDAWLACVNSQGMPGSAVVVEITERVLMKVEDGIKRKLLSFRDAGVQVALDDFGTGYSSLAYLKRFDIDFIKIDQLFVRNITTDADDLALCQAMIAMAHRLGLKVVAEGVEDEAQHALLEQAGCDYAQGYLYSRPVPVAAFEQLVEQGLAAACQHSVTLN
ncbi:MAG: EAL domain-containing protein [Alcaligenaceae bacterium]|nr:EAL domain-containing protein [Alcaligenaceae bacterium]